MRQILFVLVTSLVVIALLTTFVFAIRFSLERNCVTTTYNETVREGFAEQVGIYENGTSEYAVRSRVIVVSRPVTVCDQVVRDGGEESLRPALAGYTCSDVGPYIECDSLIDGNGDGVCAPNGGETCCRIDKTNGETTCKNSILEWRDVPIPVRRLSP